MGVALVNPKVQFFSSAGAPLANGTITVYVAGTTTPTNTWTDEGLTALNTNPITLDSRGEAVIWTDPAVVYKFLLKNAGGATQYTVDNIKGSEPSNLRTLLAASSGSSLVGHIASGTGSTARTVQAKLRDQWTYYDFGAVGDGSTDDTAAIVKALTAASAVRAQLVQSRGTFAVTGVACSGLAYVNIVGGGGTLYLKDGSNNAVLDLQDCDEIRIAGIAIDANKAGQELAAMASRVEGCGIYIDKFLSCEILGNTIENASAGAGILVSDTSVTANPRTHTNISSKILGNTILECGKGAGAAFTCDAIYSQANNVEIANNRIIHFNDYGIVSEFGANISVHDNQIDGDSIGVYGVAFQGCFNFQAKNNTQKNMAGGVVAFTQSNPIADPYFNIFGLIDGNTISAIGVPISAGNNYGVHVSQFGPTFTVVAKVNGASGNTIALSSTGGHFTLPAGGVLAGGAYGVPASGTVKLASVAVGDTITVNGVTLTGVASGATAAQFNVGPTDAATAESIALQITASAAGVDAYSGSHIAVRNNTTEKGDRGVVFNADVGAVENNTCGHTNFDAIRVQGYRVAARNELLAPTHYSYINVTSGPVSENRGNVQRRYASMAVTNPAYGRPFWIKTDDTTGHHAAIVVFRASGEHPTGPAPVFVERRLLVKSSAGVVTVADLDAGPVGDTGLLTITGGANGSGRAELLCRPSTGVMTIDMQVELVSLDSVSGFYILEV